MNGKEASIAYKMKGLLPSDLHKSYYQKRSAYFHSLPSSTWVPSMRSSSRARM